MSVDEQSTIQRSGDLAWVSSPGRVVVLRLWDLSLPPVTLSRSAAEIWDVVGPGVTLAALVRSLCESYHVPSAEIEDAVLAFLSRCVEDGLLKVS